MKARIHHKDGNPLNNPSDGHNWVVLCPKCHWRHHRLFQKKTYPQRGNLDRDRIFGYLKRVEIIKSRNCRCEDCGEALPIDEEFPKEWGGGMCEWCGSRVPKGLLVHWQDNHVMCKQCFDEWIEMGCPKSFHPGTRGQ